MVPHADGPRLQNLKAEEILRLLSIRRYVAGAMGMEWGMRMVREAISEFEFGTNLSSPSTPTPLSPIDLIIGLLALDVPSQNPLQILFRQYPVTPV